MLGRTMHLVIPVCLGPWFAAKPGPGKGRLLKRRSKDPDKAENPIWRDRWEAKCLLSD